MTNLVDFYVSDIERNTHERRVMALRELTGLRQLEKEYVYASDVPDGLKPRIHELEDYLFPPPVQTAEGK